MTPIERTSRRVLPWAVGLGAFLLFQVQFVVAKWFLPWFGGAASVWTTCMLFFQTLLLAGYLYAHLLAGRFSPRRQAALHVALLLAALVALAIGWTSWPSPLTPGASWRPGAGAAPLPALLGLLGLATGLPYLVLSTTGPLLQAWFVRLEPGREPWRLYAVSNAGSLLGLVSYPVVIEPLLPLSVQGRAWSAAFLVYAVLVALVALAQAPVADAKRLATGSDAAAPPVSPGEPRGGPALWVLLAGTSSLALLAVTNQLTLDVAAFPFLWVAPLAVYLATFVACFGRREPVRSPLWGALLLLSAGATAAILLNASLIRLPGQVAVLLLLLLSLSMVCHGELARLRPEASRLTGYYLAISTGGALGGLAAAVVAPALFRGLWELPIVTYLGVVLFLGSLFRAEPKLLFASSSRRRATLAGSALLLAALGGALGLGALANRPGVLVSGRNFYGWFVVRREAVQEPRGSVARTLYHGRVLHGEQFEDAARRRFPTTYFGFSSGVALALRTAPGFLPGPAARPLRVGVVGLGAGTLAAYSRKGDLFRFYEIDPAIAALSQGKRPEFTFLSEAPGTTEIVLGDARLALEREGPGRFDLLVLDAFSSDSIPVHLLTREAFAVYARHLAGADSVIAVHLSNLHLDLERPVRAAAATQGFSAIGIPGPARYESEIASFWLLVSASPARLAHPVLAAAARPFAPPARAARVWTDDYSNVLGALRVFSREPRAAPAGP